MTDWEKDCFRFWGKILNGTGAHWCAEFDFLPIDDTCAEVEYCTCGLKGIPYGLKGER